jgi:hypothetical protein
MFSDDENTVNKIKNKNIFKKLELKKKRKKRKRNLKTRVGQILK